MVVELPRQRPAARGPPGAGVEALSTWPVLKVPALKEALSTWPVLTPLIPGAPGGSRPQG